MERRDFIHTTSYTCTVEPPKMDTLGAGLFSFVERLSLSRRLTLSKLAPRPRYVWLASSPGFPVWVRPLQLHAAQTTL